MKKIPALVCPLFLLLLAAPLAADGAADTASQCQPAITSTVVDALAAPAADGPGSSDGTASRSYCAANCQYGSATTNCSGTCTAVDQNCNSGVRGHVTCNGQTVDQCDPCPTQTCTAQTFCPDGTVLSCSGTAPNCYGGGELCLVACDGNAQFCPGYYGMLMCDTEF